jgi:UDP-hydrolysing UDP-N-acetyl-D-glucosamine 2-epimerase
VTVKTVAAVTVARSDYGILRPVLRAIAAEPALRLRLIVTGAHGSAAFGSTMSEIERDGFAIADRVDAAPESDAPLGVAQAMGSAIDGLAAAFARCRPDLLLLVGDRFETLAAASAAVPFTIPIAHVHGGELTEGASDEQMRHAITKLSHLHFVAAHPFAKRLIQMGEEPWRVTVSGAPGLDNINQLPRLDAGALARTVGMPIEPPVVLVTLHPETLRPECAAAQVAELAAALETIEATIVATAPNADVSHGAIVAGLRRFVAHRPRAAFVPHLGTQAYFGLMRHAAAMIGNSSSGLIEAPSFELPVVNIGERQAGRLRAANVIDVKDSRDAIAAGIRRALSPEFHASLGGLVNPYGDGHAAPRIAARLASVAIDRSLMVKRFHDLPA